MKPGQTVEESIRELVKRAAIYFQKIPSDDRPDGMQRWLDDYDHTEMWEAIERSQQPQTDDRNARDKEPDVPWTA